jgi:hypothetical protein
MADAKSNSFEASMVGLIFNASSIANLAQNATTGPVTDLVVALHTASPGEAGSSGQGTSECAYTSYARVKVPRDATSSGWTITANSVSPSTNITFPQATGGSETVTHFSISISTVSTAAYLYYGAVTPNISVSNGVTPRLTTATAITEL